MPKVSTISKNVFYLIKEEGTNWYKIGITSDLTARMRSHQTGNPRKLEVSRLFYFGNYEFAKIMEVAIMQKLPDKDFVDKTRSEWFYVNDDKKLFDLCNNAYKELNKIVDDFYNYVKSSL